MVAQRKQTPAQYASLLRPTALMGQSMCDSIKIQIFTDQGEFLYRLAN
jgi:hypothetical protein